MINPSINHRLRKTPNEDVNDLTNYVSAYDEFMSDPEPKDLFDNAYKELLSELIIPFIPDK